MKRMNVKLNQKVIVVTGSSRGIGRALAEAMAENGANVVVHYNRSVDKAQEVYESVCSYGGDCMLVQADLTDEKQVREFYKSVISHYGKVDVLINNAGKCKDSLCTVMSENTWSSVVDTNLSSTFFCCKHFSKAMINQNCGKIFNVSSYKGIAGCKGQVNYSASKAGLIGLTKSLAKELSSFGICVNAVCPGFILTSLNNKSPEKVKIAQDISLLPISMNKTTLVNTMVFMASDLFENVTGQVINIDSRVV